MSARVQAREASRRGTASCSEVSAWDAAPEDKSSIAPMSAMAFQRAIQTRLASCTNATPHLEAQSRVVGIGQRFAPAIQRFMRFGEVCEVQ